MRAIQAFLMVLLGISLIAIYFTMQPIMRFDNSGIPTYERTALQMSNIYFYFFINMLATTSIMMGLMMEEILYAKAAGIKLKEHNLHI